MHLQTFPFHLQFLKPFHIAHTARTGTNNCYVLIEHENQFGWGECVFPPYYPETQGDFVKWVKEIELPQNTALIGDFIQRLLQNHPQHSFGIAAIDIALHNLKSKLTSQSISAMYQVEGEIPSSSFTIGITDNAGLQSEIESNESKVAYFKLKVSQDEISRIVSNYTSATKKPFVVDANQGFTDKQVALKWCEKLADMGVDYMEQPFKKDDFESHAWLKSKSPIPIIADESFQNIHDLERVVDAFDGANVKLMKCGGIFMAQQCLTQIKQMGLKSVIGCMSESTVASDAAWNLAPMADWVDLDGPLLLKNDPFKTKREVDAQIEFLQSTQNT